MTPEEQYHHAKALTGLAEARERITELERDVEQLQKSLRFTVDQGEKREKELHDHRRKMLAEQRAQLDAFGRFGRKVAAWLRSTDRKTVKTSTLILDAVECGIEGLDR